MKKLYSTTLKVEEDLATGYCGFSTGIEGFDPGWSHQLLFHDLFEHFFENTKFFNSQTVDIAGECVAMGIRHYFYENSGLDKFMSYNKQRGVYWNTAQTIIGLLSDVNDSYFTDKFEYTTLKGYEPGSQFENFCLDYADNPTFEEYYPKIEAALEYGYWLGQHLFDHETLAAIYNFMENLTLFIALSGIKNFGMCDIPYYLIRAELKVNVYRGKIVGHLITDYKTILITSEMSEGEIYRKYELYEQSIYSF